MKKGWQTKRIGEVCDLATGGTPSRSKPEYFGGDIKWLVSGDIHQGEIFDCERRITEAGIRNSNAKLLPPNSVMIALNGQGKTRATVALLRTSATCNQSMVCMTPKANSGLLPEFLYANLHGRYEEIRRLTSDDDKDRRGLNMSIVRSIEIPVPPLVEQQRIVDLLDRAFEGLAVAAAKAEKNLQNARELFESRLAEVFSRRGDGWVETTLGKIGKVSMCKRIFKEQTSSTGDIPFYKIGTFGKVPDAFIPRRLYEDYRRDYSFPKSGAVLLSASGTIGRRVIYDGQPAYFQDSNIVWIDNDESQILNDFLYHLYGACEWDSTQGATISRLYNDDLRRMIAAFPSSLEEQRRLASQLDALFAATQSLSRIYEQKQAALAAVKRSLLHQAFGGNL
jgi:type I restriction enzyme S subunit